VTDFGIARQESNPHLTHDGQVLGTVYYMSPEQVEGLLLDGRSDIYSLGVVGFYILSGQLPFAGDVPSAVLLAHVNRPAPSLASVARDLPPAVAQVIDRCLLKEREARYADGEALAEALGRAAAAAPPALTPPAGLPQVLSEPQAQAIWRRAAELQAEATQRLQIRLRGMANDLARRPRSRRGTGRRWSRRRQWRRGFPGVRRDRDGGTQGGCPRGQHRTDVVPGAGGDGTAEPDWRRACGSPG
jgi:serine/threonine protein kinase